MIDKQKKKYLVIAIIALVAIVTIMILSYVLPHSSQTSILNTDTNTPNNSKPTELEAGNSIIYDEIESSSPENSLISNYDNVVRNLPESHREYANQMLLYTLQDNGVNSVPGDITIRDGTYQQSVDDSKMLYTTTYIIDIPSVKQSYRITDTYSPISEYDPTSYATVVTCLNTNELIYGDFGCHDQIMQEQGR